MKQKDNQTVYFKNKPRIIGNYSIVGPKEGHGRLSKFFHLILDDDLFGEKTYEKAECKMLEHCIGNAIDDAKLQVDDVDVILSGDLLNQTISSNFAARCFNTSFIGLYGACSTMAESLALGACLVNAGYFNNVVCGTASHFSSAERQYRFPLELGNQRPPSSQWTVTGSGACVVSSSGKGPKVTAATFGKVIDFGVKDVNDMGSAMAPAAAHTISSHLKNTNTKPEDYDLIVTGDLGKMGGEILLDLLEREGIKLGSNYCDCGQMMYTFNQDVCMGGSGAGCSASVLNSLIINGLKRGEFKKVLFVATGALLSTTSTFQGESIPCIAHAVVLEAE